MATNFHKFDLNLLRGLDALLRERSVTRAAERLNLTQQAMSGTLRRLREYFDDDLLRRSGRGMQLTAQGEALIEPVRAALLQVEQALAIRPEFDAATSGRCFKVAMSDYAAVTLLPQVMACLSADAPDVVLDVRPIDASSVERLESGDLDLCMLPGDWSLFGERAPRDVLSAALYEDDFVCVVGKHNGAIGPKLDADDYLALPHVALRLGNGVSSLVEAGWRKLGIEPKVAATAANFGALVVMVADSPSLIATVQRRLARQFARMLPIRIFECPVAIDPLKANMNWHAARRDDPALRYLRQVFQTAAKLSAADNS